MRQVVAHVISGLSGWYTYNLTHGTEPLDYAASWNSQPELPRRNAERLARLVEAADEFAELVATIDLDAPCHVFQSKRTARAWLQREATETAIHLRDAQEVLSEVTAWPAERAAASIDETLRIMWHGALLLRGDLGAAGVPDDPIRVSHTEPPTDSVHELVHSSPASPRWTGWAGSPAGRLGRTLDSTSGGTPWQPTMRCSSNKKAACSPSRTTTPRATG